MTTQTTATHQPAPISRREALALSAGTIAAGLISTGAARASVRGQPEASAVPSASAADFRLLCMNIWVGGRKGMATEDEGIARTLAVLRAAHCDIIAMQEQNDLAEHYAQSLGYHVFVQDRSTAVLTRFEILGASEKQWGVRVAVPRVGPVWVFNVHFPAAPYQPYQLAQIPYHDARFIATEAEAITEARLARGEPAHRCLREVVSAMATGEPVIVAGDFNEPSHLDWTEAAKAAGAREHSVAWPTTRLFADAGLVDALRALHPDPAVKPAFTWTPRPAARDVMDRIDMIHASGSLKPVSAEILGESGPMSDCAMDPWPSDHRAVRVTLTRA